MSTGVGRVSGHYAGAFTRLVAFVIDWLIVIGLYGLILGGGQFFLDLLFGVTVDFGAADPIWYWLGLAGWAFLYLVVGLTIAGRSIGKAVVGLKVVTREGRPIGPGRASVRVVAFPLNFLLMGLGFIGIILGRERRALHDVISGSTVVYDWGDRPAELPAPLTRFLERRGVPVTAAAEPAEAERVND